MRAASDTVEVCHTRIKHRSRNKFGMTTGFTLAEVLITIGIIGVVAALTIPGLVAGYQEQALKTQFKKAYSVMSQNLQKTTMVDYDGVDIACAYSYNFSDQSCAGCNDFFEKFTQNMKVIKTCGDHALAGGCIPEYPANLHKEPACNVISQNNLYNYATAYVFPDGMILIPFSLNGYVYHGRFFVDVNGKKGPNKPGYDLFDFMIRDTPGGYKFYDSITACFNQSQEFLFKSITDIYN
jgi:prepilin-type N-terminal cleavage/methylation domain-containing protein